MTPYFSIDGIELYHGDARDLLLDLTPESPACFVLDPPWEDESLAAWARDYFAGKDEPDSVLVTACEKSLRESLLVFTDSRRTAGPIEAFGPPGWIFVWDTMNTWSRSRKLPVQRTKLCLWYGDTYDRDATTWGTAPERQNGPTTTFSPLDGRRLADVYQESIRWLHNPGAGSRARARGTERFGGAEPSPMRHAKPLPWVECLIGNTSSGPVVDPFLGSGTSLVAARALGRPGLGIEIDEETLEFAATRILRGDSARDPAQYGLFDIST